MYVCVWVVDIHNPTGSLVLVPEIASVGLYVIPSVLGTCKERFRPNSWGGTLRLNSFGVHEFLLTKMGSLALGKSNDRDFSSFRQYIWEDYL